MKKISLLALLLLSVQLSFAQFSKGEKEYITRFSFEATESNGSLNSVKRGSFGITNQFGWFVKDNLAVGLLASYSFEDYYCDGGKNTDRDTHTFSLGLYSRKYFSLKRFSPYIQSNLIYSRANEFEVRERVNEITRIESITDRVYVRINPGLQFSVNDWFSLEGNFNSLFTASVYSNSQENGELTSKRIAFTPGMNLSFSGMSIGARFKI